MDQQAQDRCHRIGQTRDVHIYRLVSEATIEENILLKAQQKRDLDSLVIQARSLFDACSSVLIALFIYRVLASLLTFSGNLMSMSSSRAM